MSYNVLQKTILIKFIKEPVLANILMINSRKYHYNQFPTHFAIFGINFTNLYHATPEWLN